MKYDMEELLRNALSPKKEPDYWLNQRIIKQAQEKERQDMSKNNRRMKLSAAALLAAAVIAVGSASAYAAWKYLTPDQVAEYNEDQGLAAAFQSEDAVAVGEVQEFGNYRITLLGVVSGKNLSRYAAMDDAGNILDDRTYVVTAIENADGTPRPDTSEDGYGEDPFFVSPLIEGMNPALYNIMSMGGGYFEMVEDGIQYRIAECDNVEKFADRQVYLCVSDGAFYNSDAYNYSEESGVVSRNEGYQGVNALFALPLDKSKADKAAAEEYVRELEEGWNEGAKDEKDSEDKPDPDEKDITEIASEETADWKLEDFEQNTELVKELEIAPDGEGNYKYEYEIGEDGLGAKGTLGKAQLADRDEGNMAKARTITGGDAQTAYIETYTLKEDGKLLLRVYCYEK